MKNNDFHTCFLTAYEMALDPITLHCIYFLNRDLNNACNNFAHLM